VRPEDGRPGERGGVVEAGAAFAYAGDPVDGDWRTVSGPGGGVVGIRERNAFCAASPRASGWSFPFASVYCGRDSGDFGCGRVACGVGTDAETAVGADGGHYSGSAGVVASAAGNGVGGVYVVGAVGRRAWGGIPVFQWGKRCLVASGESRVPSTEQRRSGGISWDSRPWSACPTGRKNDLL